MSEHIIKNIESTVLNYKDMPTILIVDDDPDIIEFINQTMRIFNERRFKIVFAATGLGAITMVNLQPIDAVVLDIKLPDITGINIGQKIKGHYPSMPIAIFTSYSGKNVEEQVKEIGAFYWYKLEVMANPQILLTYLNNLLSGVFDDFKNKHIISDEELKAIKERRDSRIEKMQFPSYLIRSRVKND